MAVYSVTLIRGDGVGPELAAAARRCVEAALEKTPGAGRIEWAACEGGIDAMASTGTPMPAETIESVRNTDATLKAPITTPIGTGFRSVNVLLRQTLDLFACVRPCKHYPGVRSRYSGIDLVVVRENCEDLYAGVEFEMARPATAELIRHINEISTDKKIRTDPEATGISIKPISVANTRRIVRFAFDFARKYRRRKVTYVHKANIMKYTDGLFKAVAEEVAGFGIALEGWAVGRIREIATVEQMRTVEQMGEMSLSLSSASDSVAGTQFLLEPEGLLSGGISVTVNVAFRLQRQE